MVGRCLVCDVDFTLLFASVTLVFFSFSFSAGRILWI